MAFDKALSVYYKRGRDVENNLEIIWVILKRQREG